MIKQLSLMILVLAFLSSCGSAPIVDEGYDLKGPGFSKGAIIKSSMKLSIENAKMTFSTLWGQGSGKVSGVFKEITEMEVLKSFQSGIPKVKITYLHASDVMEFTIEGETSKEETFGPLCGETAIFEFRNGKWEFEKMGRAYTPEQLEELKLECEGLSFDYYPGKFYPDKRVKPGYSWAIEGPEIVRLFGTDIKDGKGSIECTFDKVVTYLDQKCALIQFSFDVSGRMVYEGGDSINITMELSGFTYRSLESHLVIRDEGEGNIGLEGDIQTEAGKMKMKVYGKCKFFGEEAIGGLQTARKKIM